MENLKITRDFFKNDKFQQAVGVVIDKAGIGKSTCSITLNESHFNADGLVQGGVIYTLADSAFAVAANSVRELVVTLSSNINYLNKTKGKKLTAVANCVNTTGRVCLYDVEICDDENVMIAKAAMTGYIKVKN